MYHHFPGGRNEMILGAARQAGAYISSLIDQAVTDTEPRAALDQSIAFWKRVLSASDYRVGCPVIALAVDHHEDLPEATDLVREIFAAWQEKIRDLLVRKGIPADRAHRLARLFVAAIEGAVILCRAERSTGPLNDVAAEIAQLYP